ncbi:uncharacterized protein LOC133905967 [Phragmites australis]|uniref:uncharacterized protein LOC133905967 n=1 Tax=Phragmites australis TaxID=29695 RepID=UPI002D795824|nr:uncharacterized protein LOC133905967 [Phragmites australis]
MEKASRRRVPAFGEWNYYYYSGELSTPAAAAEGYAPAPVQDGRSDVWFRYPSPPRRKPPPSKVRRLEMDKSYSSGKRGLHHATNVRASDAGAPTTVRTPAKAATPRVRVVRSVDADLYQVPPPDFVADEPTLQNKKKASRTRSLWMGCLGFNCFA